MKLRHQLYLFLLLSSLSRIGFADNEVLFLINPQAPATPNINNPTESRDLPQTFAKILPSLAELLPRSSLLAFRTFGHLSSGAQTECQNNELQFSLQPLQSAQALLTTKLSRLQTAGKSPLTQALQTSGQDFSRLPNNTRHLILITSQEDTCQGRLYEGLQSLLKTVPGLHVHSIGYRAPRALQETLAQFSTNNQGLFFTAHDPVELFYALYVIITQGIEKTPTTAQAITGGETLQRAIELPQQGEYQLGHHQKLGYFDYFFTDLAAGDELNLKLRTTAQGIRFRDGAPILTGEPYAGLQVQDAQGQSLLSLDISGTPQSEKVARFFAPTTGRYYLAVGSAYDDMNKDAVFFRYQVERHGDLDSDKDAGATLADALPLIAKRYERNSVGGFDQKDSFGFQVEDNTSYTLGIIPQAESNNGFKLMIFDSYRQKIYEKTSGRNEGLKTNELKLTPAGPYYVQLELLEASETPIPYTLELIAKSTEPATEKSEPSAANAEITEPATSQTTTPPVKKPPTPQVAPNAARPSPTPLPEDKTAMPTATQAVTPSSPRATAPLPVAPQATPVSPIAPSPSKPIDPNLPFSIIPPP